MGNPGLLSACAGSIVIDIGLVESVANTVSCLVGATELKGGLIMKITGHYPVLREHGN
jgi:hypothetical protein